MVKVGDWVRFYGELMRVIDGEYVQAEDGTPYMTTAYVEREFDARYRINEPSRLCAALPRQGEWWHQRDCYRCGGSCTSILSTGEEVDGICWSVDAGDPWHGRVQCGCLTPINFGKGPPVQIKKH